MQSKVISDLLPGTRRRFHAKSPIIYQGEIPRCGYYVMQGLIKAYTLDTNGDEQIVTFYQTGDFFPLPWLLGKTSSAIYYHETITDSTLISITQGDMSIFSTNTELLNHMFDTLVQDHAANLMRITALEQHRAEEKILFTLYYLTYRFGKINKDGKYIIDMKLTHAVIASLVGLTRETTATELNKLRRKKIISYAQKLYVIDRKLIERAISEDGFSDLVASKHALV